MAKTDIKTLQAAFEESRLIYDRYGARVSDTRKTSIHIFGSSSKGNSVYFTKIRTLIDLGLPMKRYTTIDPNFFFNVDYLILTHEHSDHINISTLVKILTTFPNVKVLIHPNMWEALIGTKLSSRVSEKQRAAILNANANSETLFDVPTERSHFISAKGVQLLATREHLPFTFTPHVVSHGPIKNLAIELYYEKTRALYSSDLDTVEPTEIESSLLQGLPTNRKFDIICLEANYDTEVLNKYLLEHPTDSHAAGNLRHISEQDAQKYVNSHLVQDGLYIPLHASRAFGTFFQN